MTRGQTTDCRKSAVRPIGVRTAVESVGRVAFL
jgi:hypothetical protein